MTERALVGSFENMTESARPNRPSAVCRTAWHGYALTRAVPEERSQEYRRASRKEKTRSLNEALIVTPGSGRGSSASSLETVDAHCWREAALDSAIRLLGFTETIARLLSIMKFQRRLLSSYPRATIDLSASTTVLRSYSFSDSGSWS